MKRIIYAWLLSAVLLCGCGAQKEEVAAIAEKKGTVQVLVIPAVDFTDALAGQKLCSGDSVKTGEAAKVTLELIQDKSLIALSENSFLEIKNYQEKELQQMSGTAVYKITPQNKELKIKTQPEFATVLGTVLRIDASSEKTRVTVDEGKVGFRRNNGTTSVLIEAGMSFSTDFADDSAQPLDPVERGELFDANLKPTINPR